MSLSLSYIYIISYFFIKIKYDIFVWQPRRDLNPNLRLQRATVLETAVLTITPRGSILTRHSLIFNGALPAELLPYMAGEDGTRTHDIRLGRLNQWIAVYAFILYYIIPNFFLIVKETLFVSLNFSFIATFTFGNIAFQKLAARTAISVFATPTAICVGPKVTRRLRPHLSSFS